MANNLDPDEMTRCEPSCQHLHCLHMYLSWSARLSGLRAEYCKLDDVGQNLEHVIHE